MFWLKPDWSSSNSAGIGPQTEARMIELGQQTTSFNTNGWWSIRTSSNGNNIYLDTQLGSTSLTCCTAAVAWVSGAWQHVAATYTPSNSCIYLNGILAVSNNVGPLGPLNPSAIYVGNSCSTNKCIRAAMDELEIFSYAMDAASVQGNYYYSNPGLDSNSNGIPDWWEWQNYGHLLTNGVSSTNAGLSIRITYPTSNNVTP